MTWAAGRSAANDAGYGKGATGARRPGVACCAGAPISAFKVLASPEGGTAKAPLGLIGPFDARSLDRDDANGESRLKRLLAENAGKLTFPSKFALNTNVGEALEAIIDPAGRVTAASPAADAGRQRLPIRIRLPSGF